MPGLLEVGELPRMSRSRSGRRPGKWRGHEEMAHELRTLASRERDEERRWGKVAERANETKAQSIVSAIKKGEAVGFEHTAEGRFEAKSRKSPNQNQAPVNEKTGRARVLYDIWARYVPGPPTA